MDLAFLAFLLALPWAPWNSLELISCPRGREFEVGPFCGHIGSKGLYKASKSLLEPYKALKTLISLIKPLRTF